MMKTKVEIRVSSLIDKKKMSGLFKFFKYNIEKKTAVKVFLSHKCYYRDFEETIEVSSWTIGPVKQ